MAVGSHRKLLIMVPLLNQHGHEIVATATLFCGFPNDAGTDAGRSLVLLLLFFATEETLQVSVYMRLLGIYRSGLSNNQMLLPEWLITFDDLT